MSHVYSFQIPKKRNVPKFLHSSFSLAANIESPGAILNSLDDNDTSFIDTLIAKEQKIAISQYVVQQYLQEIWQGHLKLKAWQFLLFFASFVLIPPIWFIFSMPVEKGLNKVPVIKVPTSFNCTKHTHVDCTPFYFCSLCRILLLICISWHF